MTPILSARSTTLGYNQRTVANGLSFDICEGQFTAIVGPNACGKSTTLRALARLLRPTSGSVLLDGSDITALRAGDLARRITLLPQEAIAPDGITVADLVARGRYPHQTMFQRWSAADEAAVASAMEATGTLEIADRLVAELSGGQRQRVWVAMALAQQSPILLLDEPTTFLDISHQYALLDLFAQLRDDHGCTIVTVLHDLNQAARYADQLIVMHDGHIVASGSPSEVITTELLAEVFGISAVIIDDPVTGGPLMVADTGRKRAPL